MSVLAIENTIIQNNHVTVEAVVEDMCLLYPQTLIDPPEYAPALCVTSFELDDDEQIPTDENGFCQYLDDRNLQWQVVDTSDYLLDS